MKHKNELWITLVFAICLACAPVGAHAAKQNAAPPPPPQGAQPAPPLRQGSVQPLPPLPHLDPDQMDAQRAIDGPYRLTYTLTEMDGGKRLGSLHYSIVLDADADAPWSNLNLGTRMPITTAVLGTKNLPQTQFSYIDLGMNIRAQLRKFANGLELRNHIVQSSVDAQQLTSKSPIIRQATLESTVLLNEGQPVVLGKADIPGSTHSLQIQVELTKLP